MSIGSRILPDLRARLAMPVQPLLAVALLWASYFLLQALWPALGVALGGEPDPAMLRWFAIIGAVLTSAVFLMHIPTSITPIILALVALPILQVAELYLAMGICALGAGVGIGVLGSELIDSAKKQRR